MRNPDGSNSSDELGPNAIEDISDLRARGFRGGFWSVVSSFSSAGISSVSFLVLSRILGPESFGMIAMVDACLALGQRLLESRLSEPLIQIRHLRKSHSDTLFWTLQMTSLILVVVTIQLRGVLERFFAQEGLGVLILATSAVLYFQATGSVPRALLVRRMRFDLTARAKIGAEAAGGLVGIGLALSGYGVWSLVWLRLTATSLNTLLLWGQSGWRPRLRWSHRHFRELWQFGASRGMTGLLQFANRQIPKIVLGRYAGATELGMFVFARQITEAAGTMLLTPVKAVAMPTFARIQDDPDTVRRLYGTGVRVTVTIAFPVYALLALTAPVAVPLLVGNRWLAAAPLVQIFALSGARRPYNIWNSALLQGLGKPEWHLVTAVLRMALTLALIFALLSGGPTGVALAILAATFLSWPLAMKYVERLTGVSPLAQLGLGRASLAATAILSVAVLALRKVSEGHLTGVAALAAMTSVGVAVYFGALAVFGRSELAELKRLFQDLGRTWRRPVPSAADQNQPL